MLKCLNTLLSRDNSQSGQRPRNAVVSLLCMSMCRRLRKCIPPPHLPEPELRNEALGADAPVQQRWKHRSVELQYDLHHATQPHTLKRRHFCLWKRGQELHILKQDRATTSRDAGWATPSSAGMSRKKLLQAESREEREKRICGGRETSFRAALGG